MNCVDFYFYFYLIKHRTPWSELKPTSPSTITSGRINPTHDETIKTECEAKRLVTTTRTLNALSKWTQTQFKDNLKNIDGRKNEFFIFNILFFFILQVPTLVQLLKDIDNTGEITEYVQPYIGSVSKAKEFATDFLAKRNQLANAEVN